MSQQKKSTKTKPEDQPIYNYDSKIALAHKNLKKELTAPEYKLVSKYDTVMINEALAKATRNKNLEIILSLSRIKGKKSWMQLTQEDIGELVANVMKTYSNETGQETNTSWDHKKILKIFFRWLKFGDRSFRNVGDPEETKFVKLKTVKDKLAREELVDENDLSRLLYACESNQRDRAFLHVHYDAGTRPGEILSLQIKHVKFDKIGAIISVDGKTGTRPIRLIESWTNLSKWLSLHPDKDNPEAPLFVLLEGEHEGDRLTYAGARKLLQLRCKKAHITKKINLKLFRHSEATRTSQFMTEGQLRKRHGWTTTSRMPSRYAHIVQADVEDAILKEYGIIKEEEKKKNVPKVCVICETPNSFDSTSCEKCGRPLDLEKAIELEEEEKKEKDSIQERLNKQDAQNLRMEQVLANLTKKLDAVLDKDN